MVSTTPFNAAQGGAGPADLVAEVEALGERLSLVRDRVGEVIFGQREVVEQALITLLSGGHALLIGVPGLAKTRLVETLGTILGLDDKRIQCTPDLMPADILGSEVLEESETGRRSFRFIRGPVFCQLLMADEINRASPRTQSALLQAMQEGRVSIAGQYHPLPQPFHVLATQNPLEQEGTYPLPEAQLDRFLLHGPSGRERRGAAPLCRLGAGAARQPGSDASLPGARPDRRTLRAVNRRRPSLGAAGLAPPHGGQLRRTRRRSDHHAGDRSHDDAAAVISTQTISQQTVGRLSERLGAASSLRASLRDRAEQSAAVLPPLLVAAERVATTVAQGVHGRRRVGQGETFWQFRQYEPGDAATRIDWRESAKSQRLYVRETEWEAAQSVWLWRDASSSMDYSSAGYIADAGWPTKRNRAELILVALASLLVRGGERLTLLGSGVAPMSGRVALSRLVQLVEHENAPATGKGLPVFEPLPRAGQLVLIGDFLAPLETVHTTVAQFAGAGLKGHLLQTVDPAEEELPFAGRVRFEGVEQREELVISRVETVREDYRQRFQRHRDGLAAIARAVGWTIGFHRTDRPPHLALLALHAALTADRRR